MQPMICAFFDSSRPSIEPRDGSKQGWSADFWRSDETSIISADE